MTFIRYKKSGNNQYAYEVRAYYDKKLKIPRQKVKYLGKVTRDGKIQKTRVISAPRTAYTYGDVAVLVRIAEEIGLIQELRTYYTEELANTILSLSVNKIARGTSLSNFRSWYECTYLHMLSPVRAPTSQNLSRALESIGEDERTLLQFFQGWLQHNRAKSTLTYDITSLSSSSNLIEFLEYGYNRDNDGLPQINLGLVAAMETELPLYFKLFPGSITDVTTLKNLLYEIQSLGIPDTIFILDRGFYSKGNLIVLLGEKLGFVMPMPFHVKAAQRIISKHNLKADSPDRAVSYKGNILHVTKGELTIGEEMVNYFLYYDENRRSREINTFYSRLIDIETNLNGKEIHQWESPSDVVEEVAGKFMPYLSWKVIGRKLIITRKTKAISRLLNRMGKTILLFNREMSWDTVLSFYRGKDTIEKMFETLKNDLSGIPLRVHKNTTLKGHLVVIFTALILYFALLKRMKKSGLIRNYSIEGMLLELSKIKKIELLDGSELTSEVSKRARDILQKLQLDDIVPKSCGV